MILSIDWAKSFGYQDDGDRAALTARINQRIGAIEDVHDLAAKYRNGMVVRVVTVDKHPDADKLSVCTIDDANVFDNIERNDQGHIQIVCGAPNVAADALAIWLPPGAVVPASFASEQFQLDTREIRGVKSSGMLAAASELDVPDASNADGIMIVADDVTPGTPMAEYLGFNDFQVDIENKMLTHRPDCFGQVGLARELCAISGQNFASPDWFTDEDVVSQHFKGDAFPLNIDVTDNKFCPYLSAVIFTDVKVTASPPWLKNRLRSIGQKSINNIVDLTNYVMHVTAQPTHAFDYDRLRTLSPRDMTLGARMGRDGEKLTLLDGKAHDLGDDVGVLTIGDKPIDFAGIMGGADTEVRESTTTIALTAGNFDMYQLRRTSFAYGVTSDALTRFSKGLRPEMTAPARALFTGMMLSEGWGTIVSPVIESRQLDRSETTIRLGEDHLRRILGYEIDAGEVVEILGRVEIPAQYDQGEFIVHVPFWRSDLHIAEDIIEEVARIAGFDRSPATLPIVTMRQAVVEPLFTLENRLRTNLAGLGATEMLLYSFVSEKLLTGAGLDPNKGLRISNAISPDLQRYRTSIVPGMLGRIQPNIRAGHELIAGFEIGRAHLADKLDGAGLPHEFRSLVFTFAASDKKAKSLDLDPAIYVAKNYLLALLRSLGFDDGEVALSSELDGLNPSQEESLNALAERAKVTVNGTTVGLIGAPHSIARKNFKLPDACAVFEIDLEALQGLIDAQTHESPFVPDLPSTAKDITLEIAADQSVEPLNTWASELSAAMPHVRIEWALTDIYQAEPDELKRATYSFTLHPLEKTLTAEEANAWLESAVKAAEATAEVKRIL